MPWITGLTLILTPFLIWLTFSVKPGLVSDKLAETELAPSSETPLWSSLKLDNLPTQAVHAANLIQMENQLSAVWYGGTKEAMPDVKLYWADFDSQSQSWHKPSVFVTAEQVSEETGRYTRIIGNPTAVYHQGKVTVFFVTVGIGGWAVSSLNAMVSADKGKTWSKVKRLVTSPFLNISNLVRAPVQVLEDGNFLIPSYFEGHLVYASLIKVSPQLDVLGLEKVSGNEFDAIQPTLLQHQDQQILLARTMNLNQPMAQITKDLATGEVKTTHVPNIKNADSAIASAWLSDKTAVVVYNHTDKGRKSIDMAISTDYGNSWQYQTNIETIKWERLGYPTLSCGNFEQGRECDLLYTVNRKFFRHIRFNEAGLMQQGGKD